MNITAFAQYAGVSKAAVSRYFNGGYLSAEKRAQIAAAVEATGYRPSMQAQMLRTRRTRQIGVIMPRLSSESCARMVEGISRVLDEQGCQLLLVNTANENEREVKALIDMIPSKSGCAFAEVPAFAPRVGGAPASYPDAAQMGL